MDYSGVTQYYEHMIQPVSGWVPMHALMHSGSFSDNQTYNRGSLVSLNDDGDFVVGCSSGKMPMWATSATTDFDSNSDQGGTVGPNCSAFVATGGYELFTTEFVDSNYLPNDFLVASDTAGKVDKRVNSGDIVGCVSAGANTEVYGQSVLYFWPMFIPVSTGFIDVPTAEDSSGNAGQQAIDLDNNYMYYCIADNTWVRTTVETDW